MLRFLLLAIALCLLQPAAAFSAPGAIAATRAAAPAITSARLSPLDVACFSFFSFSLPQTRGGLPRACRHVTAMPARDIA